MELDYNLMAEISALLIITVSMTSFLLDEKTVSSRHRIFGVLYYATFASILVTLASIITAENFTAFPLWLTDLFKLLYFLTSPIAAPIALFYAISLGYRKGFKISFIKKYVWAWLPYAVYCLIVLTNFLHHAVFVISPTQGYGRGPLVRISYIIAILYAVLILAYTIMNIRRPQRTSLLIICLNLLISSVVFGLQLFFPPIQLSGLASVSGILVIHFYLQSVTKVTDPLTELKNRQALTIQLTRLCDAGTPFSLIVCSLRNFKGINERLGLEFGDTLLESLAIRFKKILPPNEIYRYSGDEFAWLTTHRQDIAEIHNVEKIADRVEMPFSIDGTSIMLDMTYARVDYPEFGTGVKEIISTMDYSLSMVKKNSGETNYIYDLAVCEKMRRRSHIIERLKAAIANNGFEAHYQPIYAGSSKSFQMAEALIRMKKTQEEPIYPGEFIPIAEETGLIVKITLMMLEMVCSDYRDLLNKHEDALGLRTISINFPYVQFSLPNTAQEVTDILRKYDIPSDRIRIELTERTLASDLHTTKNTIDELVRRGFSFELDDFGVEYSNLTMFLSMPVDTIKFDRSLVLSATETEVRRVFFLRFLQAVKVVGIEVVMEGVEDEELLNFLLECGSDYIQGYIFSKPLPQDEFVHFLEEHR